MTTCTHPAEQQQRACAGCAEDLRIEVARLRAALERVVTLAEAKGAWAIEKEAYDALHPTSERLEAARRAFTEKDEE